MDSLKKVKIDGEWFYRAEDIITVLKGSKDLDKAISTLQVDIKPKEEKLSDFNEKLKKGLNWSPKK